MKSCTINKSVLEVIANCNKRAVFKIKVTSGINTGVEKCPQTDIYWRGNQTKFTELLWKC